MVQIPTPTGAAYFQFPIPTGEEIYNQLMAKIEPVLMTSEIPSLQERYKDETPEQKDARTKRYDAAFAEYEKQYAQYATELQDTFKAFKKEAVKESQAITSLDQQIASA